MKGRQSGAATLFVTVIILALLTLIAVVSTKIGLFELKTSANTNRAKEALSVAQGGLDYGAVRYMDNASWSGESLQMPYGGPGASVAVSASAGTNSVVIKSTGKSLDTTGLARVQEKFARVPLLDVGKLTPLMANGNFPDSGTFSIVTNPNGGGTGVPVSGWTEDATKQGYASWQTCNVDEWLYNSSVKATDRSIQSDGFTLCDTCKCSAAAKKICDAQDFSIGDTYNCPDIVVEPPGTIPDVFVQLFGIKPWDADNNGVDDWKEFMQAEASVKMSGTQCSKSTYMNATTGNQFYGTGKNAGKLPLIWVDGDCNLPSGQIASYDTPIILFVHGAISITGSPTFYGILFGFSDNYATQDTSPSYENFNFNVSGGPVMYGVMLSNNSLKNATGGYTLVYSKKLLDKLANVGDKFYDLARYPGTWTDTK